jgi:hypothetical protein
MPEPFAKSPEAKTISMAGTGIPNRTVFAPGEEIRFHVPAGSKLYLSGPRLEKPQEITNPWDSSRVAPGNYLVAKNPEMADPTGFVIAQLSESEFGYQIWTELPNNRFLANRIANQVAKWGMQSYLPNLSVENMDTFLAAGVPVSLRINPVIKPAGIAVSWETCPDFFRLNIDRKPIPYAFDGGRPTPGIT